MFNVARQGLQKVAPAIESTAETLKDLARRHPRLMSGMGQKPPMPPPAAPPMTGDPFSNAFGARMNPPVRPELQQMMPSSENAWTALQQLIRSGR